jgi:hypothetical protein
MEQDSMTTRRSVKLIVVDKETYRIVGNYMKLIDVIIKNKKRFEVEIHPDSLHEFQIKQLNIIDTIGHMIMDTLEIPKDDTRTRIFYLDCIQEHYLRKTITKKHLKQMLISWEEYGIIKQAE